MERPVAKNLRSSVGEPGTPWPLLTSNSKAIIPRGGCLVAGLCPIAGARTRDHGVASSDVLLLRNVVSPSEVDADLPADIEGECSKFGTVRRVYIHNQGTGSCGGSVWSDFFGRWICTHPHRN